MTIHKSRKLSSARQAIVNKACADIKTEIEAESRTREDTMAKRSNDNKMTCARCGKKVDVELLKWAYVYFPKDAYKLERVFELVCPRCRLNHGA